MRPTIIAISLLLLTCCGTPAVPAPDAGLPEYTGQERCECMYLDQTRERRGVTIAVCRRFWGCGLDNDATTCRVVCAWTNP